MRFLIDAQLPPRLAEFLIGAGHDAVHVESLPDGVRTTDVDVAATADRQDRIVVTKDADFRHSHVASGRPARLLVVMTGNIANHNLIKLFRSRLNDIEAALESGAFVELHRGLLVVHGSGGSR